MVIDLGRKNKRMNVLEKILEEIDNHAIEFESFGLCDDYVSIRWMKDIIRSYMDDVPECGECSRRKWYQIGYEDAKKENGWIPVSEPLPTAPYIASKEELDKIPAATPEFLKDCKATAEKYRTRLSDKESETMKRKMNIPEKCIDCVHHKVAEYGTDYCDYIENWNGYAGTAVPYPNFYKQEYPCKGHESKLNLTEEDV